jgi:hypothetical protein
VYHKGSVLSAALALLANLAEACPRNTFCGKQGLGPGSSMWDLWSICGAPQEEEEPHFALCALSLSAHHH